MYVSSVLYVVHIVHSTKTAVVHTYNTNIMQKLASVVFKFALPTCEVTAGRPIKQKAAQVHLPKFIKDAAMAPMPRHRRHRGAHTYPHSPPFRLTRPSLQAGRQAGSTSKSKAWQLLKPSLLYFKDFSTWFYGELRLS